MKQNNKILLIGTTAECVYNFRKDLILTLVAKGYEVYAFTTDYIPSELEKISALGATPVPYVFSRGGLNPLNEFKNTIILYQKIKKINPYLVLSYFAKPAIFGTLAAKMAKVPRIFAMLEGLGYTFTEQPEGLSTKTKFIKLSQIALFKLSLPLADGVIFLNPDDPKDLLVHNKMQVKNVHVLGGIGVDLEAFPYSARHPKNNVNFLFIGRLLKEKGINEFIEASKIVKNRHPQAKFVVLGAVDNSNLGSLTGDDVKKLVETDLIIYPGRVDNIAQWIEESDVFVLPSYREGVPKSTQEAMAIGRAVITTDVPGCRETVIDGVNGFLVPKWNPQALAEKMFYFIENPEIITQMGEESYKIAEKKFDSRKVNENMINILGL